MDEFYEPETEQCIGNEGKAGDNSASCSIIEESNVTKVQVLTFLAIARLLRYWYVHVCSTRKD